MMIKSKKINGYKSVEFKDYNGVKCSVEESGVLKEKAIWLGVDNVKPLILASRAKKHNVKVKKSVGLVEYPLPEDVLFTGRMYLTVEQVKELLPYLKRFVKKGELYKSK